MKVCIVAVALVVLTAVVGLNAQQDLAILNCNSLGDNGQYNLSTLLGSSYVKVVQQTDNTYQYTWRICNALSARCHNLTGVVACQAWQPYTSTSNQRSCGLYSTWKVSYLGSNNDEGVQLSYSQGDSGRTTAYIIRCGPNTDKSESLWSITNSGFHYEFSITHIAGCPNGVVPSTSSSSSGSSGHHKSSSSSKKGGLSGGSIFLIVLLCCTVTYFVGGILFLKFVMKKEGKKIVPNVNFWTALPGLIWDGIKYTSSLIKALVQRLRGNSGYSTVG